MSMARSEQVRERGGKKSAGSGGIRTHASEETGALNQRLRPLGHATSDKEIGHGGQQHSTFPIVVSSHEVAVPDGTF